MGRTSAQQRDGYAIASSAMKRKFVRRNDQKNAFALLGSSLRRVSLLCPVRGQTSQYHALIVDPTPYQEDIQCDRCPKLHKPTNPYCTGNRHGVRSRATVPNYLYSIRTGAVVGRGTIISEFAGPKRKTASAIMEIEGAKASLPIRFPDRALHPDESPLNLIQ